VIFLTASKILVVMWFYRFLKSTVYFAINGKSSAGTILLFELHPPLSRL